MDKTGKFNNRLLITYLPAFLIFAFSFLIILTGIINELKSSHVRISNRQMVNYVLGYTEQTLLNIDMAITLRANRNEYLHGFIESGGRSDRFIEYKVTEFMDEFCFEFDVIHSIYVYHIDNDVVLSTFGKYDIAKFPDVDFLSENMDSIEDNLWYSSRSLNFGIESEAEVISMLLPVPRPGYVKGIMVVNILTKTLNKNIKMLISDENTYLDIINMNGKSVFNSPIHDRSNSGGKRQQNVLLSSYNGWKFLSGVYTSPVARLLEGISLIWIILGLLLILSAVFYLFVISKANYEPVKNMLRNINQYYKLASKKPAYRNDLRFLESAITDLIETSHLFQELHEEDLQYRKKVMFLSLINNTGIRDHADWCAEFRACGIAADFSSIFSAIFEIDRYHEVAEHFSKSQKNIAKYMVQKSITEVSETHRITAWGEWISEKRYSVIFFMKQEDRDNLIHEINRVLGKKVDLSITIGVGGVVDKVQLVYDSYYQAYKCLELKVIYGNHQVLVHEEMQVAKNKETFYQYMSAVVDITHKVNICDDSWIDEYNDLIENLSTGMYSKEDIKSLFQYFYYNLKNIASKFPQDLKDCWENDISAAMRQKLDVFETLEGISAYTVDIINDLFEANQETRNDYEKSYRLREIKKFIDERYDDPQMSLEMLSDKFNINKTFLSRLFKMQFDQNFVEYLIEKRVKRSIELLSDKNLNIDEIARRVGYSHYVSFTRSFKKITGMTPGEYRNSIPVGS